MKARGRYELRRGKYLEKLKVRGCDLKGVLLIGRKFIPAPDLNPNNASSYAIRYCAIITKRLAWYFWWQLRFAEQSEWMPNTMYLVMDGACGTVGDTLGEKVWNSFYLACRCWLFCSLYLSPSRITLGLVLFIVGVPCLWFSTFRFLFLTQDHDLHVEEAQLASKEWGNRKIYSIHRI